MKQSPELLYFYVPVNDLMSPSFRSNAVKRPETSGGSDCLLFIIFGVLIFLSLFSGEDSTSDESLFYAQLSRYLVVFFFSYLVFYVFTGKVVVSALLANASAIAACSMEVSFSEAFEGEGEEDESSNKSAAKSILDTMEKLGFFAEDKEDKKNKKEKEKESKETSQPQEEKENKNKELIEEQKKLLEETNKTLNKNIDIMNIYMTELKSKYSVNENQLKKAIETNNMDEVNTSITIPMA